MSERKRIHLIGVCGTAMATLAALLRSKGHDVRGSDQNVYPPMSDFLRSEGIPTDSGYSADHITSDLDLVVVGNAISRGNPELEAVLERKIRYCSMPEAIRDHFLWGARSIVVAGTHGKTTTTSLTGWLLTHARLDPTILVGGIALNLGDEGSSYRVGAGREFVIEGDEYDSAFFDKTAKFLKYLPDVAVVNNIEFDHADIYANLEEVMLAFRRLVRLVPRNGLLLLGTDSEHAASLKSLAVSPVETFGVAPQEGGAGEQRRQGVAADTEQRRQGVAGDTEPPTWEAHDIGYADGMTRFDVRRNGQPFGRFESPLLGVHNVRNALAAIAVGTFVGIAPDDLAAGLKRFRGIKRRLETVGVAKGVTVLDDFAHHPTAVHETLAALRTGYPSRRIWAVFEPRSASSCRRVFQDDFARAFESADETVIAAVFRSNLPESERLSAEQLVAALQSRGKHARHIPDIDEIIHTIASEHRAGDVVVLMSNGGFGGIHRRLLQALETW